MAACGKEAFVQSAVLSLGDGALRRIRPGILYTSKVQHSPYPEYLP
jgi:hypothetical protein